MSKSKPKPTAAEVVQAVRAELAAWSVTPTTPLAPEPTRPTDHNDEDQRAAWSSQYDARRRSEEARAAEAVSGLAKAHPLLAWSGGLDETKTHLVSVRAHLVGPSVLYRVPSTGRLVLAEVGLATAWGERADTHRGRLRACLVEVSTTDVGVCAGTSRRFPFDSLAEAVAWVEAQVHPVEWVAFGDTGERL